MSVKERSFGFAGGDRFDLATFSKLSLRVGKVIDQITIDSTAHGGMGGLQGDSLTLAPDEFVRHVEIRAGVRVDFIRLTTNLGNILKGGNEHGGEYSHLDNVRVLRIGGSAGDVVNMLTFEYEDTPKT